MAKFDVECALVQHLVAALRLPNCDFDDPHSEDKQECGIDVIVRVSGQSYGVQVTVPGDRSEEVRAVRAADDGAPFLWVNANAVVSYKQFATAIERKGIIAERHDFSRFEETWLLMVAGTPEYPGTMSTLLPPSFESAELGKWTDKPLRRVKYDRVFILSIVDVKPRLLMWTQTDKRWIDLAR